MGGNKGGLFGGYGGMGGYGNKGGLPSYFGYGGYIKKRKILDTGLDYYTPTFEAQICEGQSRICDCDCDCKCKKKGVKTCQQKLTPQYKKYYVYDTYYYQPKEEDEEDKKKEEDVSTGFSLKQYYLYYLYQKIISQMFSAYQTPNHDPFYQSPNYDYQHPSGTNHNYDSNPPQTPHKPYGDYFSKPNSPYPPTPGHHYPPTHHNPDQGSSGGYHNIYERSFDPTGENDDSSRHSQYDPYPQYPSYNTPSVSNYPFHPYQNGGGQQQTPWWHSLYFGGNQQNSYFDNHDITGINYLYSQSPQVKKVFLKVMVPDGCECKRMKKSKKEEDESIFPRSGCI